MSTCGRCGSDSPARARYCIGCGAPIGEAMPAPAGSRRVVAVLFSDLVGSTTLGERLDQLAEAKQNLAIARQVDQLIAGIAAD